MQRQIDFLGAHPDIALVGAWADLIDEGGRYVRTKTYPVDPALASWSMSFLSSILHPAVMVRREVLERVGYYPVGYRGGTEDYALGMKISQVGRVCSLGEVLLKYRIHSGNLTRKRWDEQEAEADRIVAEGVAYRIGTAISLQRARQLRGLSTDQFPRDAETIGELGVIVSRLYAAFVSQSGFRPAELSAVRRDVGVRLWLLAALAATRAPRLAGQLAGRAMRISPMAVVTFGAKAANGIGRRAARLITSHG